MVDRALAEDLLEVEGRERVHLVVCCQCDQSPDPGQIDVVLYALAKGVPIVSAQAGEAGRCYIRVVRVDELNRHAFVPQLAGDLPRPAVGADDQQALGVGLRHAEQACDGGGGESVDHYGANDHEEADRDQQPRVLVAGVRQLEGEHRGDRRGDDAARSYP